MSHKTTFAPGGNSESFGSRAFPRDLPSYLSEHGLDGIEIECGRGVRISRATYDNLPSLAAENGIYVSLHAPYYISLSSESADTRLASVGYILESARAANALGAEKIVVHSGSCAKMTREQALSLATDTLQKAQAALDSENLGHIIMCPETMGKINQLGTLDEVLAICGAPGLSRTLPCVDFGHLYARTLGGIRTKDDFTEIFDKTEQALGLERAQRMHIHFSQIMYTAGGEKKHVTFADNEYVLDYRPMCELLKERGYTASVVCESAGTQAEDAAVMKRYYDGL
ncbi:hypothetical protein FACS1894120_2410 [Clostridia bacterium]|nr:hypothetical protein FACS1894120_2410 [Clostridia bacterium]